MRRVVLIVSVVGVLLMGGCGIPDNSQVKVLRAGPSAGPSFGDDNSPPVQFTRDATTDPGLFITYFLQAAAGDPETAVNRVKDFLAPDQRASFNPQGTSVQVIRMPKTPLANLGDPNVTLTVQQVGVLQEDGQLIPTPDDSTSEIHLQIGTVEGQSGLFVLKTPQVMLLTDTALDNFYQAHTIYFWNSDNTGLVPDVRYMPASVPTVQQPTMILNWLTDGPADWLRGAVNSLPQGTTVPDNIPAVTDNKLEISLSQQAVPSGDADALDRLRRQLQWSLGSTLVPRTLEIKIRGQNTATYVDAEYLDSNAASRLLDSPERFVIYNGVIRRLSESPRAVNAVPVLKTAANKNVEYAAMSGSTTHTFAAVVGNGGKTETLRVGVASSGQEADLKAVPGLSGTLGHPVWAVTSAGDTDKAVGLITADGRLYSFGSDGSAAQAIEWQSGDPGTVTSASVAPDGHRVVVVAGGRLYRTVLTVNGDGIGLSAPQQIVASGLRTVYAAAWSSEGWLDVAGVRSADDRVSVISTSIDGALTETRLADIGTKKVTYLTSYPANPVTRGKISDESSFVRESGDAWDVLSEAVQITTGQLAGPAGSAAPGTVPTAPFYLD